MNAHRTDATTSVAPTSSLFLVARESESPWEARGFGDLVPPATLVEARARRDELAVLLGRERDATADFLLALADFDRRRGWERLGHASLFAFLTRELGLSAGAAQLRLSAARLLPRHPAVEAALRGGRLCLSAAGQLARVLTVANEAEVLPRFFGCSSREAQEVAAAILPAPVPVRSQLVTEVRAPAAPRALPVRLGSGPADEPASAAGPAASSAPPVTDAPLLPAAPPGAEALHAHEVSARACAAPATRQVVPLTADLRRLHLTVTADFLEKVAVARTGLSHALPGATTEQVLQAALDLLLEQQARRKALVKRPRKARGGASASAPASAPTSGPILPSPSPSLEVPVAPSAPPPGGSATSARPHVPAEIERAVRLRDGDRCQFPIDAGGVCGSTWQVELDHVVPVALDGPTTAASLRCACAFHNRYAAELALGPAVAGIRCRKGPATR